VDTFLNIAVTILSWSIFGQHVWATRRHFVPSPLEGGARFLVALVWASVFGFTILLWIGSQPIFVRIVGFAIELLSLALFRWAITASRQAQLRFAFDPSGPHSLLQDGPYRHIRHPFYSSYLLFWAGWAVATWSPLALPSMAAFVAIYISAARGEERRFAATNMSQDYLDYRRRAGLFWPVPFRHRP